MNATKRNPPAPRESGEAQPKARTRARADSRDASATSHASRQSEGLTASPDATSDSVTPAITAKLPAFSTYTPLTGFAPAAINFDRSGSGYKVDISRLVTGYLSGVGAQGEQKPADDTDAADLKTALDKLAPEVRQLVMRSVECSDTTRLEQQRNHTPADASSETLPDSQDDQQTKRAVSDDTPPPKFLHSTGHQEELARLRALWEKTSGGGTGSYRKFAAKYGIGSYSTVSSLMNGHMSMSLEIARKFADAFDVPLGELSPRWAKIVAKSVHPQSDAGLIQRLLDVTSMLPRDKQLVVLQVAQSLLPEAPPIGDLPSDKKA